MMVLDSSALLAILFDEFDKSIFENMLSRTDDCVISAVNAYEAAVVARARKGAVAAAKFWDMLASHDVEIIPFDELQARAAAAAFDRFGKGVNSKAKLNLCDCAAYALATTMNAPLLFKGNDFPQTDVLSAV
jgi:ribonuclease VapC